MLRARVNLLGVPARCAGLLLALLAGTPSTARPLEPSSPAAAPPPGWVVVSVEHYRALHAQAFPRPPAPPPVPLDLALGAAEYELHVDGDTARGRLQLAFEVWRAGWVSLPLPAELLLSGAQVDGAPATLLQAPAPAGVQRSLWLPKSGPARATLEVVVPVVAAGGSERLVLPALPAALTRVELSLTQPGLELGVTGGLLVPTQSGADPTRRVVYGHGDGPLELVWRRSRSATRAGLPPRLRAELIQHVGLGEDAAPLQAELGLEVTQGDLGSVSIALPPGFSVHQVLGPLVSDWSAVEGALEVRFAEPLAGRTRLTLSGETRTPRAGPIAVPLLRLPAAERETGGVAVEVLGAGELGTPNPLGLDPADVSDLGGPLAGRETPSLSAFRYRPQAGHLPRSLTVEVLRYAPQAVLASNADEARYLVLATADGKCLVQASYAVRSHERSFLALRLPPGVQLWSARVAGRTVRPGRSPQGALLLPLPRRRSSDAPALAVEVVYVERRGAWGRAGQAEIALPAPDLPVSRSAVELYYPAAYRLTVSSTALRSAPYYEPLAPALTAPAEPSRTPAAQEDGQAEADSARYGELVRSFRKEHGGHSRAGLSPLSVRFPRYGPALFFTGELALADSALTLGLKFRPRGR